MSKNKLYGYNKWYKPLKNKPEQKVERKFEGKYELNSKITSEILPIDFINEYIKHSSKPVNSQMVIKENLLFKNKNNSLFVVEENISNKFLKKEILKKFNNEKEVGIKKYSIKIENKKKKEKEPKYYSVYNVDAEYRNANKKWMKIYYVENSELTLILEEIDNYLIGKISNILKYLEFSMLEDYNYNELVLNLIKDSIDEDKIDELFNRLRELLKGELSEHPKLVNALYRESKKSNDMFEKIQTYLNIYFSTDIIFDSNEIFYFILNYLKQYQGIMKKSKINFHEKLNDDKLINTYVLNDKHTTYNDGKSDGKKRVAAMNLLINKISQNTTYFDIEFNELFNKFYTNEFVDTFSDKNLKRDNKLFVKYKEYYSSLFNDESVKLYEYENKLILKYIYKFFKGRIRKMIQNPAMEYEKIFRSDIKEKCRKDILNKVLEYILYEGKLEQYNIESPDTNDFQRIHAYEELYVDTMLALWNVNYKFMPLKEDILGHTSILEGNKIKNDKHCIEFGDINKLSFDTIELLDNIEWLKLKEQKYNEAMADDLTLLYEMRSKILHGGLLFENKQFNKMKYDSENIEVYLNDKYKKISQKYIKSLNLEENLSKNQESKILNINCNFNEQLINFFPSSSKIVNSMIDEIQIVGVTEIENSSKYNELKNVGKFLIKRIYELALYEDNNQENSFLKYLESNLKDNKDKKTVLDIYREKYLRAQSLESRGKRGKVKEFQDEIINMFKKFYIETYSELLIFNTNYNNDNIHLQECNILKIDKKVEIKEEKPIVYAYALLGIFIENDKVNILRNRVEATIKWLEKLNINDDIEQLERIYNNLDIINDINNYEYKVLHKEELTEEEREQIELCKENIFITEYNNKIRSRNFKEGDFKKLEDQYSKYFNVVDFIDIKKLPEELKKELSNIGYEVEKVCDLNVGKIKERIGKEKGGVAKKLSDELIKQVNENLKEVNYNRISKYIVEKIKYSKYEEYVNYALNFKDNSEFKKIYFQEDMESEIFRENVYRYTNLSDEFKESIKEVYDIEQKVKELSDGDIEIFKNSKDLEEKEINVKEILTKINKLTYGKEKNNKLIEYIKSDGFSKIINSEHYESFNDFKKDYDEVVKYKKIKDIIEHRVPTHLYKRLNEINWRFGQFLVLLERDMNYFIKGLKRLDILGYEEKINKTSPFIGKRYELDECSKNKYMIFIDLLGLDKVLLEYEKKERDNIRNYIAHSYIIREPFELSIIEIGERLDKLMEYRSLYKKAVKVSLINCIKEDVTIDYKKINQYFEFKNIDKKYNEKKVSKLELDCNKSEYKKILDNFLSKKK